MFTLNHSATVVTLDAESVAQQKLRCSKKTFQNNRKTLERAGFPRPLDIPGQPLWVESDIDAWFLTRRQAAVIDDQLAAKAKPQVEAEYKPEGHAAPVKRGAGRPRKIAAVQQGGVAK